MTFVAQPYERFADDLLLALTGGVAREEHPFTGVDAVYGLGEPGAHGPSLRVSGQHGERHRTFEQGVDYRFDADGPALRWLPGGRSPDPDSHFSVSYDLVSTTRRLTDRNPGSVTTLLASALGRELAVVHREVERVYWSAFADTATGPSLQHVAALLGLSRKDARFASGEVLFNRSAPADGDIAIPVATHVSTREGVRFATTDVRTLRRGQLSVVVPVRAVLEGPEGRVEPRTVVQVDRPVFGIDGVVNELPTVFSSQREDDAELRRRIRATLERAGRSTVDAIRYALVEEVAELTDTNVQVVERPEAPGLVDVRLGLAEPVTPELVAQVEDVIFRARPAGVRVTHDLPTGTPSAAARRAAAATPVLHGASRAVDLPAAVLAAQPPSTLELRVQVLLRPAERNLAVAQRERITDDVRARVTACVERVPMGADVVHSRLVAAAVHDEDVVDAVVGIGTSLSGARLLALPAAAAVDLRLGALPAGLVSSLATVGVVLSAHASRVHPHGRGWEVVDPEGGEVLAAVPTGGEVVVSRGFHRANVATAGRRPSLRPEDVVVAVMDEAVEIDVRVVLEPVPAPAEGLVPLAGAELRSRVGEALERAVVAAPTGVHRAELLTAVREALTGTGLQLVPGTGLALNARYVETGRLLNATEEVELAENHVPRLRVLDLVLAGALDA